MTGKPEAKTVGRGDRVIALHPEIFGESAYVLKERFGIVQLRVASGRYQGREFSVIKSQVRRPESWE